MGILFNKWFHSIYIENSCVRHIIFFYSFPSRNSEIILRHSSIIDVRVSIKFDPDSCASLFAKLIQVVYSEIGGKFN